MAEIPQFDPQVDIHQGGAPSISPGALAAPGEAMARGGAELSDVATEFAQRVTDARRSAQLSNLMASAGKGLNDLYLQNFRTPDHVAAGKAFDAGAAQLRDTLSKGIDDPLLQQHFLASFDAEATGRSLETQRDAFGAESDKAKGDLDRNLLTFAQNAATATDPLLRAKIIDDGNRAIDGDEAAKWINGDEAENYRKGFTSRIQQVAAEQLIDHAVQTQDPQDSARVSALISDPKNFPGLDPQERESLAFRIDRLNDRLENRALARQAHEDAVGHELMVRAQGRNESIILGGIYNNKTISSAALEQLAVSGQISSGGLETIHAAMDRTAEGTDDALTSVQTWHAIDGGTANANDVYDLVKAGKLSGKTAATMVRSIDAGSEPAAKNAVDVLKRAVSGSSSGQISFGGRGGQTDTAMANALGEFHARVANGEAPNDVLDALIPKYAPQIERPSWLLQPKLGAVTSLKDLMAVAGATVKAHDAHQIDDATYGAQVDLLNEYRGFYQAKDEMDRARASRQPKRAPAP